MAFLEPVAKLPGRQAGLLFAAIAIGAESVPRIFERAADFPKRLCRELGLSLGKAWNFLARRPQLTDGETVVEFAFGDHVLDVDRRELRRGAELIAVEPQVFDLLVFLVRNRDCVVSKDNLIASVWGGRIVSESTLTSHVHAARRAVGDNGEAQRLIRTLPRKGFRFIGDVQEIQRRAMRVGDMPSAIPPDSITQPPAAPRLSIVVLPFTNLSDDREQQYFADGITEDLTTDLSRIAHSFVISPNTAFTYRNKPIDTKQIGRELGVRYVLEGSVRRFGNQVRVTAQLIDAETDTHLWAERFDRNTSNLFELQDGITGRLANALGVELISAEAARSTEHPDALDYILRGRAAGLNTLSRAKYDEAIPLFERAMALDPHSVEAQSRLADMLIQRVTSAMSNSPAADIVRAKRLVGQALAASPRSSLAHFVRAQVLQMGEYRYDEAIPEYETALLFDRNSTSALNGLGICKLFTGSLEEVIPLMEQAIRLSPRDPQIGLRYWQIGRIHLLQSRIDEAILWLEKARGAMAELVYIHAALASAYGLKGDTKRAAAELAEARRLVNDDRYSSLAHLKASGYWGVPKIRALFEATYFAGLRKAGMPEE